MAAARALYGGGGCVRGACARRRRVWSSRGAAARADASASLRLAAPADAPAVRRLVLSEYMNPLGLAPERFVVAQDDASGDVVGCGQLKPWQRLSDRGDALGALVRGAGLVPNWEGDLVELASLVVAPGSRGKGLGSRIVGRLLEDAPQGGTVCLLTTGRGAPF